MSTLTDIAHGLTTAPNLRDWQHANKIFCGNNYALAPKYSHLFHLSFNITGAVSRFLNQEKLELGFLVKNAQIPKYTLETKTMNAYNRPNIIQQKVKYDPITITFHDDGSDVVRDFWYNYYSQYYRDSDYYEAIYYQSHKYDKTPENYWGYQPAAYGPNGSSERLLNSISIYSLDRKRFTEYILINPMITSFQHGQHQQGSSEFLENTMTVAYESVLYNYGTVKFNNEPAGFADLNYDKAPSPLTPQGGGTNSILGPGGILDSVQGVSHSITDGNYIGAGLTAYQAFTKNSNQNLAAMAQTELTQIANGILQGDTNVLNRLALPKPAPTNGSLAEQQSIGD